QPPLSSARRTSTSLACKAPSCLDRHARSGPGGSSRETCWIGEYFFWGGGFKSTPGGMTGCSAPELGDGRQIRRRCVGDDGGQFGRPALVLVGRLRVSDLSGRGQKQR